MRYVALLRAINVGGNSIIKMADLRACVAELGHANVRTYIASGNVLFDSPERGAAKLDAELERAIERTLGLSVPVVVRRRREIETIAAHIPSGWIGNSELRVTVAYLLRGADARTIAKGLNPKDGIDRLITAPGALIWATRCAHAHRAQAGRDAGLPTDDAPEREHGAEARRAGCGIVAMLDSQSS